MQKIIIMNSNNKSELFTYSIELEAQAATAAAAEKKTLENRYCIWKAFRSFFIHVFLPIVKFTPFFVSSVFHGHKIVPFFIFLFLSDFICISISYFFLIFCGKLFYYSMTITIVLIEKIYIFLQIFCLFSLLCSINLLRILMLLNRWDGGWTKFQLFKHF